MHFSEPDPLRPPRRLFQFHVCAARPGVFLHIRPGRGPIPCGASQTRVAWDLLPSDQPAFMESRLGQALATGGVTAVPSIRWVPLLAYHTPGS